MRRHTGAERWARDPLAAFVEEGDFSVSACDSKLRKEVGALCTRSKFSLFFFSYLCVFLPRCVQEPVWLLILASASCRNACALPLPSDVAPGTNGMWKRQTGFSSWKTLPSPSYTCVHSKKHSCVCQTHCLLQSGYLHRIPRKTNKRKLQQLWVEHRCLLRFQLLTKVIILWGKVSDEIMSNKSSTLATPHG